MTPDEYILTNRYDELIGILDELELPFHEDLIIRVKVAHAPNYDEYEVRYVPPRNKNKKLYSFLLYRVTYNDGQINISYKSIPSEDKIIKGGEKFFDNLRIEANYYIERKTKLESLISKL